MHLMKQSRPSGPHALPLCKSVKQLLQIKAPEMQLTEQRRPSRFSKTHHWLVSYQSSPVLVTTSQFVSLADSKADLLGCFVWKLLIFTAVARELFVMEVLQSYSKMFRVSLCNEILCYFKREV